MKKCRARTWKTWVCVRPDLSLGILCDPPIHLPGTELVPVRITEILPKRKASRATKKDAT